MFTLYVMGQKGYEVLNALVEQGYGADIDQVVGARDKQVQADYFDEIQALCTREHIAFAERTIGKVAPSRFSLAISWRWLLAVENLIVLHDSLLPRYRGFAPLVSALVNGDSEVGVTALLAAAEFDRGDVVIQKSLPVQYPAKVRDVIDRISRLFAQTALEIAAQLKETGSLRTSPQDDAKATYSLWRDDEDYAVDWTSDAGRIERFVNAVGFPYKGASTRINDEQFRIWDVESLPDLVIENRTPGKVLFIQDGLPTVVCGTGLVKITNMTRESGEPALPLKNFRIRFR